MFHGLKSMATILNHPDGIGMREPIFNGLKSMVIILNHPDGICMREP